LQRRLDEAGLDYEVVNMGVSGDTSAGGVRRLDWALDGDVRVLIVALGANDALRGLPVDQLERNLSAIVDRAKSRRIRVLLCGMEAPPNYGTAYTREFRHVFTRLAQEKEVTLLPFILEGVAGVATLNQADGIHPTAEGARRIADLIWPHLAAMLRQPATR
jgi:acyl-CoA thioesterase I